MHAGSGQGQVPVLGQGNKPGRGGVNRGRGDAPMTWGPESSDLADRFKARVLPPNLAMRPEDTTLLGVGAAAPTVDAQGEAAGLSDTGASSGKAAWRRRLSPRHRRAVGTFFQRGDKDD